ncbi:hypothetical protein HDU81_000781, partial [Chytriomyces hyalinus]
METQPIAPEHVPYLEFDRQLNHIIHALLKPVFGSQVENLLNLQYWSLDDLFTKLCSIEEHMGWTPKSKNLTLYASSAAQRGANRGPGGCLACGRGNLNCGAGTPVLAPDRVHPYNLPTRGNHGQLRGSFGRGTGRG